jgi:ABC-type phosphate transport system substrate-binding protein
VCGGIYRLVDRYLIHRKLVSITPVFDQVVNKREENLTISVTGGQSAGSQESHFVQSLVILRFANAGTEKVGFRSEKDDRFRISFPNRRVRVVKVREPEELMGEPGRQLSSGRLDELRGQITSTTCELRDSSGGMLDVSLLHLPDNVTLARKEAFQLAVFLSGTGNDLAAGENKIEVRGELEQGKIVFRGRSRWRRLWPTTLPALLAAALAVSFGVGALTAHRALTPRAACVGDLQVEVEGSTAFAHVVAEAAADYTLQCPSAKIVITADGSDKAIADHGSSLDQDTVLMVDESGQAVPADWKPNPVGMVIFAVVANSGFAESVSTELNFEIPDGGYTAVGVGGLYRAAAAGTVPYVAVGRTSGSGTALEFGKWAQLAPSVLDNAPSCPAISAEATVPEPTTSTGVCDVGTTQKMLDYINDTTNAIGFAEIDALEQYPNVTALPIDGAKPDQANVLNGTYKFAVPEYLYTAPTPSVQVASFMAFLQSPAETAQLAGQDAGFIPCDQLSGSVAGDCDLP